MVDLYRLLRPALFALDAETAHKLAILALRSGLVAHGDPDPPSRSIKVAGLDFPNPVGLAAGFDKNAEIADAVLGLGFGFVEIGTVTPRPQAGNPRPRLFRLTEDQAVINRMGFNNQGLVAVAAKLRRRREQGKKGIVGANIGANKDSDDRIHDYVLGVEGLGGLCEYFTLNISSPNTPGLRDLQAGEALRRLLSEVAEARDRFTPTTPFFLKVAPDLDEAAIDDIATIVQTSAASALIVANTTLARPTSLQSRHAREAGGLSGKPLLAPSTAILRAFHARIGDKLPLIGVGGIGCAEDAKQKFSAGASLVQLYSALVYQGPGLVERIKRGLDVEAPHLDQPHFE